jgi:hypothetical protein
MSFPHQTLMKSLLENLLSDKFGVMPHFHTKYGVINSTIIAKLTILATTINWRFTTADARIKLKRLYPSLEPRKRSSKKHHVAKKS